MAIDVKKFLSRFAEEARDHIARLEAGLTTLENGSTEGEAVNALFRSAHTLKGSSRMLKLVGITETAHQLEDVLGALREGKVVHTPELGDLLLRGVDAIHAMVEQLEASGGELPPADPVLCAALARAATGEGNLAPAEAPAPTPVALSMPARLPESQAAPEPPDAAPSIRVADTVRVRLGKLDELIKLMGEIVSNQVRLRQRLLEARELDQATRSLPVDAESDGEKLAGHARAMHRFALALRDDVLEQERLCVNLNDRALVMRMLPLNQVFDPAARMVRELARSLGKDVRCEVGGGDIELDRHIIDRLGDALVHVLRNAIDHGIESPEQRRAAGKPPAGRIRLTARQEGAGVLIEATDDGRGLDRDQILAKAIQKGLIEPGHNAALTDDQVAELIFRPGFSTSAIITDLSGRGVGMDAVKRTIVDDLHGAVSISSRPGEGNLVAFKLPLTLAIMRVLLFQAARRPFGLAAQHVVELIRARESETILVAGRPALVLRNEFVPLIPLAELLGLPEAEAGAGEGQPTYRDRVRLVVVIGVRQAKLGLMVDQLLDERDMVVKPLPEHLRGLGLASGMVMTGVGDLASVLQAQALLEAARRARGEAALRGAARDRMHSSPSHEFHILVVDDSLNTREIEKEVLEAYGYRVTVAEDGLEGWQKAVGGRFDAVLTDVEMPGMDGFSLTAKLRENEKYRTTPIIIVTSREKEEDKRRGIQVGADAYIVKGDFDQSNLVDTLRNLLG